MHPPLGTQGTLGTSGTQPDQAQSVQAAGMEERDLSVVARGRDGDRDGFRALVDQHSRYVYSLAHRMTGNAQDAEDVVQESWLKAHRQLSRFEARADFRTWLHRITVNCSIDLIRARRHREDAHDPILADAAAAAGARTTGKCDSHPTRSSPIS